MERIKDSSARTPRQPPARKIYYGILPTTTRYKRLSYVAQQFNVTWQDVIRQAIDEYLAQFPPEKDSRGF